MRIGNDRRSDDFEINVVSLIDVLLTLLMFFVLTTTFVQHSRLKVELPQASAEDRDMQPPAITIMVDRDGHFYVGSDEVAGEGVGPLKDAIEHLSKTIPKKDHNHPKVLTAATILTRAAEGRDFMMHAHIATVQALNRNVERVFDSSRKEHYWRKRKLKRDE